MSLNLAMLLRFVACGGILSLALSRTGHRGRIAGRAGGFVGSARISRADVAAFMLEQIDSGAYLGAAPGVCWP